MKAFITVPCTALSRIWGDVRTKVISNKLWGLSAEVQHQGEFSELGQEANKVRWMNVWEVAGPSQSDSKGGQLR